MPLPLQALASVGVAAAAVAAGAGASVATILVLLVTMPQDEALRAEALLRQACEVVWEDGTTYQIDRCTRRAMSAMGDENRLRDNELKRLLIDCERELEKEKTNGKGKRKSKS